MSIWFNRNSARYSATVPLSGLLLVLTMTAMIFTARYMQNYNQILVDASIVIGLGFVLFLIAKCSVLMTGNLVSWGSAPMKPVMKFCYRAGYGLIVLGSLFLIPAAVLIG